MNPLNRFFPLRRTSRSQHTPPDLRPRRYSFELEGRRTHLNHCGCEEDERLRTLLKIRKDTPVEWNHALALCRKNEIILAFTIEHLDCDLTLRITVTMKPPIGTKLKKALGLP